MSGDDIEAIRALLHRYADAVCRADIEAWACTWCEDGVWEIGRGPVTGRAAIRTAFATSMGLFHAVKQVLLNHEISVDGDRATGRAYMSEIGRARSGRNVLYLGHYDDIYRRDADGHWLFERRTLHWHYQGPPDLTGVFGAPEGYHT